MSKATSALASGPPALPTASSRRIRSRRARTPWTADQLRGQLFNNGRHDVVFLAGHFNANDALAADYTTDITSSELANSATDFTNTIVFSQGCHSGYNLVDVDGIPQVSDTLDWAQAFAQKRATLIAGTGYQYGDSDLVAYSEAIYADFSKQLLAGSGPVSVGDALVAAKKAYLAATPTLGSLDTKALLEASVFGLPMLSVDFQHGRGGPIGVGNTLGLNPVVGGTGPNLGLQVAALPISPINLTSHTKALTGSDGADDQTATWYSGPDGTATTPYVPVLPVISKDVTIANQVLRGVGFTGGNYGDTGGIVPAQRRTGHRDQDPAPGVRIADVLPDPAGNAQLLRCAHAAARPTCSSLRRSTSPKA